MKKKSKKIGPRKSTVSSKNLDISMGDKFTKIFISINGYNLLSLACPGSANVH